MPTPRTWGGRRRGAGRKPSARRMDLPHRTRPEHKAHLPVHVTLRSKLCCLRDRRVFTVIRAGIGEASREGFHVVHFSIQANHVHLFVEAEDTRALSRGVSGLAIRIARALNMLLGRNGRVWEKSHHRHELGTPREVRNGLKYVLQNWKKHVVDASGIDPCSSGEWFDGWREPPSAPRQARSPGSLPVRRPACSAETASPVEAPRTWLASRGWRRHGLISFDEAPSLERGRERPGKVKSKRP